MSDKYICDNCGYVFRGEPKLEVIITINPFVKEDNQCPGCGNKYLEKEDLKDSEV